MMPQSDYPLIPSHLSYPTVDVLGNAFHESEHDMTQRKLWAMARRMKILGRYLEVKGLIDPGQIACPTMIAVITIEKYVEKYGKI